MNSERPATPSLARVRGLERPDPALWTYYIVFSLVAGPLFWLFLIFLRFRYRSLRYGFDEEGVSMRWGVLFRREIHLTYARIQDIHLVSNAVERWLGLARIQIQTASASAKAEMTLEGLPQFEEVRDFLYSKMRGLADEEEHSPTAAALEAATEELRAIRRLLEERRAPDDTAPDDTVGLEP